MNKIFLKSKSAASTKWIFGVLCVFGMISSCKEDTILPPDLVPIVDNINTFQQDTFTVLTTTVFKDSLLTGGTLNNTNRNADGDYSHALGVISLDGVFGKTVASAYLQVRQPNTKFEFSGTGRVIDSVVLGMNYLHAFGDTVSGNAQTFSLFRSPSNLTVDSAYYNFNNVPYSGTALAQATVDFNTLSTDSPTINGVTLRPQIRFNMNATSPFVTDLDQQTASTAFEDYSSFANWLGGFYITPNDTNAPASTLGFFDTYNATMFVYYRFKDANNDDDTAVAVFPFDPTYCVRFNQITRNYSGSNAQSFISNDNTQTPPGDSLLFVQGEPGLAALISFPYMGQFPNAIINKAELTFTVVSLNNFSDTMSYNIPDRFQLVYINENGEEEILSDYLAVGANRVGGTRDLFTLAGLQRIQYKFNISNAMQQAVTTQNSNFKLKMSGARSNFPADKRVVLRGSGSAIALEKPKLNIIFTKIQR